MIRLWILILLLAMGGIAPEAHAAYRCDLLGGTTYQGCENPLQMVWHGNAYKDTGPYYSDVYDAIDAAAADMITNHCPGCSLFFIDDPYWYPCVDSSNNVLPYCWAGTSFHHQDPSSSDASPSTRPFERYGVGVDVRRPVTIPGNPPQQGAHIYSNGDWTDNNGGDNSINPYYLSNSARCDEGFVPFVDADMDHEHEPATGPEHSRFWVCVPTLEKDLTDGASCGDSTTTASCLGPNPVQLASGAKLDHVVDYANQSPFPIVWDRSYHSRAGRWVFGYERSLRLTALAGGARRATLRRPDGVQVRFQQASTSAPWTLAMGPNQTVLSKLASSGTGSSEVFTYANLHDQTETYNAQGQMVKLADRAGRELVLTYGLIGGAPHLTRIDDDAGRFLDISWSSPFPSGARAVAEVSDGVKTIAYMHHELDGGTEYGQPSITARRVLHEIEHADGTTTKYRYDGGSSTPIDGSGAGLLTQVIAEDGLTYATYTYDGEDRVILSEHGNAQDPTIYTWTEDEVEVSPALGFPFLPSGVFDRTARTSGIAKAGASLGRCPTCLGEAHKSVTYDAFGNPVATIDQSDVATTTTYDTARGLPTLTVQDPGGPHEKSVVTVWETAFRKPTSITEPVATTTGTGTRTTSWTYNAQGSPLTQTTSVTTGGANRIQSWTYNSQQQPLTYTDARGAVTTYTYDADFNLASTENDLGHTVVVNDSTHHGLPLEIEDANGLVTKLDYDDRDRLVKIERGSTLAGWETTLMAYTDTSLLERVDTPQGGWAEYEYDLAHRLDAIETALGRREFQLDPQGRPQQVQTEDAGSTQIEVRSTTYNIFGEAVQTLNAQSQAHNYTYRDDGQMNTRTNPMTDTLTQVFDALGRLEALELEDGGLVGYDYDISDQMVSVTDQGNFATTYGYNGFGDRVSIQSLDTGLASFTYDANGNMLVRTDARGATATHTYDELNRVTQVVFAGTGLAGVTHTFTYDSCPGGVGRMCGFTDASGATSFEYDLWGRVVERAFTPAIAPLVTLTTTTTYDAQGRPATLTYPSGQILTYGHTNERLTSLSWAGTTVLSGVSHRALEGQVTGWTWGGGLGTVAFSYDQNGRIVEVDDTATRVYTRDALGQVLTITDATTPAKDQTFVHLETGRLRSVNRPSYLIPMTYSYINGDTDNRSSRTVNSSAGPSFSYDYYSSPVTNNRLTAIQQAIPSVTHTWTYDDAGNATSIGTGSFEYDAQGRMTVYRPSGSTRSTFRSYLHNALGQRTIKALSTGGVLSQVELRVHDEMGRLLGRYDATGTPIEEVVYLDGWRPVATVRSTGIHRILTDHLGTPREVLDPAGLLVWSWDSKEPFGDQAPTTSGGFVFDHRFAGQWHDAESGLFHNGFRDYHARAGRYIQADPLGLAGGLNPYAYAGNSPMDWVDPLGQKPGDAFDTQDEAAIDALSWYRNSSDENIMEYGGLIYLTTNGYFATTATTGLIRVKVLDKWEECGGHLVVAAYHTHPPKVEPLGPGGTMVRTDRPYLEYYSSSTMSQDDFDFSDQAKMVLYMGDRGGRYHKVFPRSNYVGVANDRNSDFVRYHKSVYIAKATLP